MIVLMVKYEHACIASNCIHHLGTYLSLGETVGLQNNTCISNNEIGSSSPRQLVCVTDRMPCCLAQSQQGQWHFPNGSQVGLMSGPTGFYMKRTVKGSVNLLYVGDNVTQSASGQFCCRIGDAVDVVQTLCVHVG